MTDHDAFVAALAEKPDDAATRLVFRDWLLERGLWRREHLLTLVLAHRDADWPRLLYADCCDDEVEGEADQGEFIRVQCRIAAIEKTCGCGRCVGRRGGGQHTNGPCGVDQEREELPDGRSKQAFLRLREKELCGPSDLNLCFWAVDLRCPGLPVNGTVWRRGFIEETRLAAGRWLAEAKKLTRRVPLRKVTLYGWEELEYRVYRNEQDKCVVVRVNAPTPERPVEVCRLFSYLDLEAIRRGHVDPEVVGRVVRELMWAGTEFELEVVLASASAPSASMYALAALLTSAGTGEFHRRLRELPRW